MKYDEYQKLVTKLLEGGDDKEVTAQQILDGLKADDGKRAEDAETIKKQKSRIETLSETNSKLFLQATGQASDKKEENEGEEKNPKDEFDVLFDARFYPGEKGEK